MKSIISNLAIIVGSVVMFTACSTPPNSSTTSRDHSAFEMRLVEDQPSDDSKPMKLIHGRQGDGVSEVLYVQDTVLMDQTALKAATLQTDRLGHPAIGIVMTQAGQKRFADVTRDSIGKRLAIIIDGQIYSAPKIMAEIPGGKATISGDFSRTEAQELVSKINASRK